MVSGLDCSTVSCPGPTRPSKTASTRPEPVAEGGEDAAELQEVSGLTDGLASSPVVVGDVIELEAHLGAGCRPAQVQDLELAHDHGAQGAAGAAASRVDWGDALGPRKPVELCQAGGDRERE